MDIHLLRTSLNFFLKVADMYGVRVLIMLCINVQLTPAEDWDLCPHLLSYPILSYSILSSQRHSSHADVIIHTYGNAMKGGRASL